MFNPYTEPGGLGDPHITYPHVTSTCNACPGALRHVAAVRAPSVRHPPKLKPDPNLATRTDILGRLGCITALRRVEELAFHRHTTPRRERVTTLGELLVKRSARVDGAVAGCTGLRGWVLIDKTK